MRDFVLPFKPEELLTQPSKGSLWAGQLPAVDEWSAKEAGKALDALVGRLLSSHGHDLAEDESFSLVFALLQSWARLDEGLQARVLDLLTDAGKRLTAEVGRLGKASTKGKDQAQAVRDTRTACKVLVFFLRWAAERLLRQSASEASQGRGRGRGRGAKKGSNPQEPSAEEARELQKARERQRAAVLAELADLLNKGALPWLWGPDPGAWQQVSQATSDAGFFILDSAEALRQREVRQAALRCIAEPLLQERQQRSSLLVATVSKLLHGLRCGESGAPFAADALALAHATPLPRLVLVEVSQHCNPTELSSQGAFQRALGAFLVATSEKLPHVVLANLSVLLPLLDVDCYPLRNAVVESIGHLFTAQGRKLPTGAHSSGADEGGGSEASSTFAMASDTKRDLLETLFARALDKTGLVRSRTLQSLTSLALASALPREQWPRLLRIATRRMQDSASNVRRASMQLTRVLVELHPYGPALRGSGGERAKSEQLLQEVSARLQRLQEEEEGGGVEVQQQPAVTTSADEEAAEAQAEALLAATTCADEEAAEAEAEALLAAPASTDEAQLRGSACSKKLAATEQSVAGEVDRCLAEEGVDREEERGRRREALLRMQDCYTQRLRFVELLDEAEARLGKLLLSRTASDVTEAIGVVVELRLRGILAATRAFDQVLGLVWSRQSAVRDAAVDAFHRIHLEGREPGAAVRALLEMYAEGFAGGSWTHTHLASVQELVQRVAERELIEPKAAIEELVCELRGPVCPMALRALAAFGPADDGIHLAAVLPQICGALGPQGASRGETVAARLERVRLLCQLLLRLLSCAQASFGDEAWAQVWALSQHATQVVVEAFVRAQVPPQWFAAAQVAMDLSFEIAVAGGEGADAERCCPDKLWEQILRRLLASLLECETPCPIMDASSAAKSQDDCASEGTVAVQQLGECGGKVPLARLGCVVFLSGHLALRTLIFLEGLQSALKRKRLADEDARANEQREKKKSGSGKKGKGTKDDGAGAAEEASSLGMAGQEEREADAFAELAERELLYGQSSFLSSVKPLVFSCLLDSQLSQDPILRRTGAISLCKFMTVSKRFCEENLQILFTVLFPKSNALRDMADDVSAAAHPLDALFEDLTLRQSLLVAVGDLLFRHPNVVEPWTGRLYATLSASEAEGAEAAELRFTALLVLTHLVLNDMMKPRAVLLVRALWLTASAHEATARLARVLFQELAKRSTNVVYNLLPEIVARLPEHRGDVEGGSVGRVQYVMQFVEKEKHVEGLIEKLSLRLEQAANASAGAACPAEDGLAGAVPDGAASPQEAVSCLAHALASMSYTDRCVLRLHDVVVTRKALHTAISYHPVVRECLLALVERARRPRKATAVDAEPAAEARGGASAATAAALDAIEQTITALAQGKDEDSSAAAAPAAIEDACAAAPVLPTRPVKRRADPENPGFEVAGKGRGRGNRRGAAGRGGRGGEKENRPVRPENEGVARSRQRSMPSVSRKRRADRVADDDV